MWKSGARAIKHYIHSLYYSQCKSQGSYKQFILTAQNTDIFRSGKVPKTTNVVQSNKKIYSKIFKVDSVFGKEVTN